MFVRPDTMQVKESIALANVQLMQSAEKKQCLVPGAENISLSALAKSTAVDRVALLPTMQITATIQKGRLAGCANANLQTA